MKIWLFALLESLIAAFGLAAFFLADDVVLASSAAVLAAVLAISKPLLSARKGHKLELYQDEQYLKSVETLDGHLRELLEKSIDPPLPHRATVAVVLRRRFEEQATEHLAKYDDAVQEIMAGGPDAEPRATLFADNVAPWSVGKYLQGLTALRAGNLKAADACFSEAKAAQTDWIAPWLGWATTLYRQGRWDELSQQHPHLCGVELLPYDAGDQDSFLELSEDEREVLTTLFQETAVSLGNYYTIAEYCRSKEQIATSREEFKKVA